MGQGNNGALTGLGNKHAKNTRCTQVQGPLVEVKPLCPALLDSYYKIANTGYNGAPGAVSGWSRLELSSRLEVEDEDDPRLGTS